MSNLKKNNILLFLYLCCLWQAAFAADFTTLDRQAETAFMRGDYVTATEHWQAASDLADSANEQADALSRLAAAHQARGMLRNMFSALDKARNLEADERRLAQVYAQLSDAWLSIGDKEAALSAAEAALEHAQFGGDARAQAGAFFSRGNVWLALLDYPAACADFRQVRQLAGDDRRLNFKAGLNLAIAELLFENLTAARQDLQRAATDLQALPDEDFSKIHHLLAWGLLAQDLHRHAAAAEQPPFTVQTQAQLLNQAERVFRQALRLAEQAGSVRVRSHAYGRLGNLYEYQSRDRDALRLTRQAIFFAEQGDYPELLYRWYWQQGRVLKRLQQRPRAIAAYRRATQVLQPIQDSLTTGYRSPPENFGEAVRPVYYELADLLLHKAAQHQGESRQALLREAMDTLEGVNVAEMRDYFQGECNEALQSRQVEPAAPDSETLQPRRVDLAVAAPDSAVLYPIPLDERLVLLVNQGDTIYQVEVPVSRSEVESVARGFYSAVQNRANNRFMYGARDLYEYLIRPVVAKLRAAQISTLVVVSDGVLRLIPFGAFHDGERFLVEEFALATTPGLSLTDPEPIRWQSARMLLVGLSEGVQGYSPLPGVPKELQNIRAIAGQQVQRQLLNRDYTAATLEEALAKTPYSIVHLATHGEFGRDPAYTYLLTYEEKLHMDRLEEIIGLGGDTPVELLTLSACKTAAGDDRAALGLAGVALKAGARSALASLWFVDDEAASLLVTEFYRLLLEKPGTSKAKALQGAQQKLIGQLRYRHPAYWGPFLLIGNWL